MTPKKSQPQKVVLPTPEEIEALGGEVRETAAEAPAGGTIDWKDKFLRAKADLQNVQRRAAEEQRTAVRFANAELLRSLLEILDDFERTRAADSEAPEALRAGVQLIYEKLQKLLRDSQVEEIEAVGRPFDPQQHEALMQQPSADHPPHTVLEQVQKGYRCFERILRPARVIVSRAPDPDRTPDAEA